MAYELTEIDGQVVPHNPDFPVQEIGIRKTGIPLINQRKMGKLEENIGRRPSYQRLKTEFKEELDHYINTPDAVLQPLSDLTGMYTSDLSKLTRFYVHEIRQTYLNQIRAGRPESKLSKPEQLLADQNFGAWRKKYFEVGAGKPYLTPPFQENWVNRTIAAINSGGTLSILSPPRHGKTDLLGHFCIWMILKNPNIRIIWVGGNDDIAKASLGQVQSELTENEALISDYGGRTGFKPARSSGKAWASDRIYVATRTVTGMRSPTMLALGRGSKILSRDADFIITDDIDDHDSTVSPTNRDNTKNWWRQNLATRKEEHTAWLNIGSRQHDDDVHGWLMGNRNWEHIVEQAHDPECRLLVHERVPIGHSRLDKCEVCTPHTDCILFPQLRTFKYLQDQKESVGESKYAMVYQNDPEDIDVFRIFQIKWIKNSYNPTRTYGDLKWLYSNLEEPFSLIGGLDPSGSGYQAAWVVAYGLNSQKRFYLDAENKQGGGIKAARETINKFFSIYNLQHWVIEENLYHGGIVEDEWIVDFASQHGIFLQGHHTYRNKWDEKMGVTAYALEFEKDMIDLAYGDMQSREISHEFLNQCKNFNPDKVKSRGRPSDLIMAGWFTEVGIRDMVADGGTVVDRKSSTVPYADVSYGDVLLG